MILNIIIIFIIILAGIVVSNNDLTIDSAKNRTYLVYFVSLILILQSGLRNVAVGADTYNYYNDFNQTATLTWEDVYDKFVYYYTLGLDKDPGYYALQKFVHVFTDNFQIYLFLIAIIFFSALANFLTNNLYKTTDIILAYILYVCLFYPFFSITGIRQTVATAVLLYSYNFVKSRKLIFFLICILIASTLHKSSLIFLPFYFLSNIKNVKRNYWVSLMIFPLLMIFNRELTGYLTAIGGYEEFGEFEGAGTITFTSFLLLVALVTSFKMKRILQLPGNNVPSLNALTIALILTPLTWINPSAMRVVQYFSIFLLVLIPNIIQSYKYESKKLKEFIWCVTLLTLLLLLIKSSWDTEYKFFWQHMPLNESY